MAEFGGRESGEIREMGWAVGRFVILEGDVAGEFCVRRQEAHDGEGGDGFSGAGFTDEAEDFAGVDGEG